MRSGAFDAAGIAPENRLRDKSRVIIFDENVGATVPLNPLRLKFTLVKVLVVRYAFDIPPLNALLARLIVVSLDPMREGTLPVRILVLRSKYVSVDFPRIPDKLPVNLFFDKSKYVMDDDANKGSAPSN